MEFCHKLVIQSENKQCNEFQKNCCLCVCYGNRHMMDCCVNNTNNKQIIKCICIQRVDKIWKCTHNCIWKSQHQSSKKKQKRTSLKNAHNLTVDRCWRHWKPWSMVEDAMSMYQQYQSLLVATPSGPFHRTILCPHSQRVHINVAGTDTGPNRTVSVSNSPCVLRPRDTNQTL